MPQGASAFCSWGFRPYRSLPIRSAMVDVDQHGARRAARDRRVLHPSEGGRCADCGSGVGEIVAVDHFLELLGIIGVDAPDARFPPQRAIVGVDRRGYAIEV